MIHKCQTPCIYYHEVFISKSLVKLKCDIRDGEEIKNLTEEEIKLCKSYKSYKDVRSKYPLTEV